MASSLDLPVSPGGQGNAVPTAAPRPPLPPFYLTAAPCPPLPTLHPMAAPCPPLSPLHPMVLSILLYLLCTNTAGQRHFVALLPLPYSALPQNKKKKRKKKKKVQDQDVAFSHSPGELEAMWPALAEQLLLCAQVGG